MRALVLLASVSLALAAVLPQDDRMIHPVGPSFLKDGKGTGSAPTQETETSFWNDAAKTRLDTLVKRRTVRGEAKNVIMFLGDGMSVPTLAAARIYMGGENQKLSFEEFPYIGLSKTYCVNSQVADSACSATAYLTGVKANYGTMGLNANASRYDCAAQQHTENHVDSVLAWAQRAGKATGVVTTTRVTHASPGGNYAHIADRDWENDAEVKARGYDPAVCKDIAQQLVLDTPGKDINVILGGGRREFLPNTVLADNTTGCMGLRSDGKNLIQQWKDAKGNRSAYVEDREGLLKVNPEATDSLLGLFDASHLQYSLNDVGDKQPSLKEMTEAAIKILRKNKKGFYLFVEGGLIDLGHHDSRPHYALDETKHFSEAVALAAQLTSEDDTLIVVSSDHAHTMSLAGYAPRGNTVFGLAGSSDMDGLPYTTLNYANGPGYFHPRQEVSKLDLANKDAEFPAAAPMKTESHGGDDVAIFARGPWADLYSGVLEQNVIPHIMAYSARIGAYADRTSDAASLSGSIAITFLAIFAALHR